MYSVLTTLLKNISSVWQDDLSSNESSTLMASIHKVTKMKPKLELVLSRHFKRLAKGCYLGILTGMF